MIWLWLVPAILFACILVMLGIIFNDARRVRRCRHPVDRLTVHRDGDRVCQLCRFNLGKRL